MLTSFLQEEHSVQKNKSLHNWSQQQSQAKIYHHSALLLQQGSHTDRIKGQVSRQANTGEPQAGIPIKTKKAISSVVSKDEKPSQKYCGMVSQSCKLHYLHNHLVLKGNGYF